MSSFYASSEVSDSYYTDLNTSHPSVIGRGSRKVDNTQFRFPVKQSPYYPFEKYFYNPRFDGRYCDWLQIRCEEHAEIRIYEIEEYLLRRQTATYDCGVFKKTVSGAAAALVPGLYRFATEGLGTTHISRVRKKFVNAAIELIAERKVVTFGRADARIMFSRPIIFYGDIDGVDLKKGQLFVKAQQPVKDSSVKRSREDEDEAQDVNPSAKRARNRTIPEISNHLNDLTVSRFGERGTTQFEPIVVENIEEGQMFDFQEPAAVPAKLPETYKRELDDIPTVNPRAIKRARLS